MAGLADGGVTKRRSPRWSGRGGKVEKCGSDVDAIYIYHSEGLTFDMNSIKEINRINQRELELGLSGKGSWHDEYKDSAYVFVGGLAYELTEGDVITILSQWGEVVDINMPRDKATGKAKGFAFVMYEDQRSTVLAVDNMNGVQVLGRTLRVDHCRKYNQPGEKGKDGEHIAPEEPTYNAMPPTLDGSDDSESDDTEAEGDEMDEEDPMAAYLRAEKKKEKAKAKGITGGDGKKKRKHEHDGETKEERRARKEAKRAKKAEKEAKKLGRREREESKPRKEEDYRRRELSGSASASRDRYADERSQARGEDRLDRAGSDRDRRAERDRSPVSRRNYRDGEERNGKSKEDERPGDRYDRYDRGERDSRDRRAEIPRGNSKERDPRDERFDRGPSRGADRERSYRDERSERGPLRDADRDRSYRDERIDREGPRGGLDRNDRREGGYGGRDNGYPRRDDRDRFADRR